jgi:signal transduction histidine kinase
MKSGNSVYALSLLLLLSFTGNIFSQDKKVIDSLNVELTRFENQKREMGSRASPMIDTIKVNLLDRIANQYYRENPNKALAYTTQELQLSESLDYQWGIGAASNKLGAVYDFKSDYVKAMHYYKRSLKIKEKTGDKFGQVDIYNNIGVAYSKLCNYPEALENLLKALAIAKSMNDSFGIFGSYNNIGLVYRNQGMYEEALKNYFGCLNVQLALADSYKVCETYCNIGDIYLIKNNPKLAMEYFKKGLKKANEVKDDESAANNYMGIGRVYTQKKNYATGLEYYLRALDINLEMGSPMGIADSRINIGYTYFKLGEIQKAIDFISKGLEEVKQTGELGLIRQGYQYLSEIYQVSGNYKLAFDNHVLFVQTQDSLFSIEKDKKIRELQVKFDLKNIRDEAATKEIVAQKELQNQRNIRNYTFAGMLLIVIFLIILILQRNKIAAIRRQKALEEERNRIGRDLHDNLGAQLSTAKMFISSLKNDKNSENILKTIDNSIGLLDSSIGNLRKIMNEMHTVSLDQKGYLAATEELVNKINGLHLIKFTLSHHKIEGRFNPRLEHELYRITQELINNTLKYANAANVYIDLLKRDGKLVLMYEDDGKGYDVQTLKKGNGFDNIEIRVKLVGGTVAFDSMPNTGARTIIEIPFKKCLKGK